MNPLSAQQLAPSPRAMIGDGVRPVARGKDGRYRTTFLVLVPPERRPGRSSGPAALERASVPSKYDAPPRMTFGPLPFHLPLLPVPRRPVTRGSSSRRPEGKYRVRRFTLLRRPLPSLYRSLSARAFAFISGLSKY